MQTKLKECTCCLKSTVIFKTRYKDGTKEMFCQSCWAKTQRLEGKIKTEKIKAKKKAKRERITESKLDSIQSKVIRTLYGNTCCTCGLKSEFSKLHHGHFLSRQFRSTRFNPQNGASQCPGCNLYLQGAQYEFGKFINSFHGEGTSDKLVALSKSKSIKIGQLERDLLYKMYKDALEHLNLKQLISEYYQIINNQI